ncbi:MAG: ATP-binding protein [Euryarchaeota archaeon]|nr:ATP-binding protein [Euryarchaeota archaeon]
MDAKTIQAILRDQQDEIKRICNEKTIIKRNCLDTWKKTMDSNLIKVVTGARRSGKSVFSFQLLGNKTYAYINFDDERLVGLKASDLNTVLEACYQQFGEFTYIFLDEIQNIEGWELFANRLHRQGFNVLITGSNAKLLSKELATHLTGRYLSMELFPFSFKEFLAFEQFATPNENMYSTREKSLLIKKLQEYLLYGGFPEALKKKDLAKNYLTTLYTAILIKDVISRYKIQYVTTLREISNYLLTNFSKYITYNSIRKNFNLKSAHTSKKYVSYLQEPYLFFLLDKFSFKYKEIVASAKKVYSIDTGMINAISFETSENFGRLLENVVAIELLREKTSNPVIELYYWKNYQQQEVDFVIKKGPMVKQLIQVTSISEHNDIHKREYTALLKASEELHCNDLLIITWDYEAKEKIDEKEIQFVPLWKWLTK